MGWGTRARLLPLVVLLSLGIAPGVARAAWTQLGGPLNVSPTASLDTVSAAAVNDVPFVAWDEVTGTIPQLYVKQWNGSTWVQDGGALNLNPGDGAASPSITSVNGVPYVAFFDGPPGAFSVYVKHWNGTAWVQDGGSVSSNVSSDSTEPSITSVDGVPYVAFAGLNSASQNNQIYVEHWNGTGWVLDGTALTSSTVDSENPSITSIAGAPYVAYTTNGASSQVFVDSFDGTSWNAVGGGVNGVDPSIANIGGVPWVAFGIGGQVYVERFDGQAWSQTGGGLNLIDGSIAGLPSLAEIDGTAYVALEQLNGSTVLTDVEQWDGTSWNQVGDPLTPTSAGAQPPSLANLGGAPFVAFPKQAGGPGATQLHTSLLTPDFSAEQAIPTDTGALLTARVRDYGATWPIAFSYGPGAAGLGSSTPVQTTDGTGSSTIVQAVSGLSPATTYSWQPFALLEGSPIASGATGSFTTEPMNGPGATGATGATGAAGPAGPTGAAGKIELVTCRQVTKKVTRKVHGHKRKVKVTVQKCTAKLVSGPVTFKVASARLASLDRGKRVYARVEMLRSGRTLRLIVVHRVRRLVAGRYELVSGRTRQTIQLARR